MIVHGKDGQELEVLGGVPVEGKNYHVVKLKHARYVDGVLTKLILARPPNIIGVPIAGEMIEVVEPQTETTIEEEKNNECDSPTEREVPPTND